MDTQNEILDSSRSQNTSNLKGIFGIVLNGLALLGLVVFVVLLVLGLSNKLGILYRGL